MPGPNANLPVMKFQAFVKLSDGIQDCRVIHLSISTVGKGIPICMDLSNCTINPSFQSYRDQHELHFSFSSAFLLQGDSRNFLSELPN